MKAPTVLLFLMALIAGVHPVPGYSAEATDNLLKYLLKQNSAGPSSMTFSLTFSNDGRFLAAGGLDKTIRIWDVSDVEATGHLDRPRTIRLFDGTGSVGFMFAARFAPSDRVLAVGTNLGGYLIDVRSGRVLAHLAFPEGGGSYEAFQSIAFSPNGRWLATGHTKRLSLWDLGPFWTAFERGTLADDIDSRQTIEGTLMKGVVRFDAHRTGRTGHVFSLSFSQAALASPRLLSAADDSVPIVWELGRAGWDRVRSLECHSPTQTAEFAPTGNRVVTFSGDQVVRVWNDDGKQGVEIQRGTSEYSKIQKVGILKDGETIVVGNLPDTGECSVVSAVNGRQISKFLLHDDAVTAIAIHPTSDLVATSGSRNTRICLWRPDTGRLITSIDSLGMTAMSVAFSPDGKSLAYGTETLNPNSLQGQLRREWEATSDVQRYEFNWGLFRGEKITRPLASVFDLTRLEPNPQLDPSQSSRDESQWKRHRLSLRGWEVDRYVTRKLGDENSHLIVVMKNGKEVNRIPSFNGQRIDACSLTSLGTDGTVGVVVASGGGKLGLHDIETGSLIREFRGQSGDFTSVAVSPNDEYVVGACRDQTLRLWSLKNPGEWRRLVGVQFQKAGASNVVDAVVPGSAAAVAGIRKGDVIESVNGAAIFSIEDLKRVLAAENDGSTVKVSLRRNGTIQSTEVQPKRTRLADVVLPLVTILLGRNGQWVAWTEQGFYSCSPGGDELFGWQVNHGLDRAADFHPATSFRAALYRPDLVKKIVESHGQTDNLPKSLTIDQLLASSIPPKVSIQFPRAGDLVESKTVELAVSVTYPPELPIAAVQVIINGKISRAVRVRPVFDAQSIFRQEVALVRGQNVIAVQAVGPGGILSEVQAVTITCASTDAPGLESVEKPDLYLLAVGVAEHIDRSLNLQYASKDARDLTEAFQRQEGVYFSKVHSRMLVDARATRDNILRELEWLRTVKARPQDYIVLFLSGHGTQDDRQNYFFVTSGTEIDNVVPTSIRWTEFHEALSRSEARSFLLLDTCHAGAVAANSTLADRSRTAYNDVLRQAATDTSGVITFASCLPHELSYEDPDWQNGAFTKAMVEGLDGKADTNQNGILTITELETYISQRIETLTLRRQSSSLFKSIGIPSNLPVARISR